MVTWRRADDAASAALLDRAEDATLFQSPAWAEFKREAGWTAQRWIASLGGAPVAGLQALLKRLPFGRVLAWAPGGPMTGLPGASAGDAAALFKSWLETFSGEKGVYARFRLHRPASPDWDQARGRALSRPARKINSGVSLRFDLAKPMEDLRKAFTSKHRYYVKQAEAAGLEWLWGRAPEHWGAMQSLYKEMAAAKALEGRLFPPDSIPKLTGLFGPDACILVGRSKGRPVTGCFTLKTGKNAFYLMAATSLEGRKLSAAYAMIPQLLERLKAEGVRALDFGGIDPANEAAKGVDHFKKGFGAAPLEYLGEWDWARWNWLRKAADAAIAKRGMS
ncbi:MAG: peptidoglycan bridge formation glycyltransferase FemA/FemB family protein [Elusimicrobia bacterium]|nr:peptidoglycan bridge formation glycyltransferase FemA/FemB family protein [Elusimicrobiota bacterium]